MADKTYEQELADIENQLGLPIPGEQKAKLIARKEEILKNPQYRYEKAHGLPTAKAPDATSIQEANTNYEDLANKNLGVLNNTPQAPKDNLDNVNDTKAIGATKEELDDMLEKGEISRAAYEKQIASLHTSDEQEKTANGVALADEGKPDSTDRPDNFQLGNKVAEEAGIDTTPSKEDTPKEKEAKKRYNKATMSIWDAYNEGIIDKETAGYFTIDALATLASNLGRRIGNVGAQFSGGTIDNNQDTSAWEQRKKLSVDRLEEKPLQKKLLSNHKNLLMLELVFRMNTQLHSLNLLSNLLKMNLQLKDSISILWNQDRILLIHSNLTQIIITVQSNNLLLVI